MQVRAAPQPALLAGTHYYISSRQQGFLFVNASFPLNDLREGSERVFGRVLNMESFESIVLKSLLKRDP